MVTEQSATNTGMVATADEDKIPINADHSGIVKFSSRNDVGYFVVQERLRQLVEETKQQVSQRFAESGMYAGSLSREIDSNNTAQTYTPLVQKRIELD